MPYFKKSTYKTPSFPFKNAHFNTIFPALFRKIKTVTYTRERIDTPDGDFLDLDWSKVGSRRLVIVVHGLEGDSARSYVLGMVRACNEEGWDSIGFNFRGCSGEMNRKPQSYHMGWTYDIDFLTKKIAADGEYDEVVLVGFSLGGNTILKYLGEQAAEVSPIVKKAVVFSVPVHIPSTNIGFNEPKNWIYLRRFIKNLNQKAIDKKQVFGDEIPLDLNNLPRNFDEFDEIITGPIHGYKNAEDYWIRCSSLQFLPNIKIPTLLVNAMDDTFLSDQCYPMELAEKHRFFHFEMPEHGGHVGFTTFGNGGRYWSEERALDFIKR
ncbi:MAG: putative alpha/beta-fold hydrolase [Paraglaciecola sp.]|jgi:predicted alpha/beta-fold hydrolase